MDIQGHSSSVAETWSNEKRSEETQTMRAGCSKAEPKIFAPPQTPFLGAQDCQNLISWRWSLPSPTDPVWWRSMQAISSYRGNRPTHSHTHKQSGAITIHCAAASAQCNKQANAQLKHRASAATSKSSHYYYFAHKTTSTRKNKYQDVMKDHSKNHLRSAYNTRLPSYKV